MASKTRHLKAWGLTLCAIALISALLIYWYTTDREGASSVTVIEPAASPGVKAVPPAPPLDAPERHPETAPNTTDTAETQIEGETPDPVAVTEAIDYLETLEEQSRSQKQVNTDGATGDSASNLTQDEMFQLVREGVSYYDSLLESGSVDFFIQTSSNSAPESGMPQASSGTWEGTFAFSGNRIAGSVTENAIQESILGSIAENATEASQQHVRLPTSGTTHFAYDGETFEDLRETRDGPLLARDSHMKHNTAHDPRFWGWNLSGEESLTDVLDTLSVEQIQAVTLDNESVYHIKGNVQDAVAVELWLNPQKSYRPERFTFASKGGDSSYQVIKEFDFIEVAPDLWFPKSAHAETRLVNSETGAETLLDTTTVHLTNVRINETISARRFTIEPPPGATIFDARTRETFIVE